jgi:hypothetical protein
MSESDRIVQVINDATAMVRAEFELRCALELATGIRVERMADGNIAFSPKFPKGPFAGKAADGPLDLGERCAIYCLPMAPRTSHTGPNRRLLLFNPHLAAVDPDAPRDPGLNHPTIDVCDRCDFAMRVRRNEAVAEFKAKESA